MSLLTYHRIAFLNRVEAIRTLSFFTNQFSNFMGKGIFTLAFLFVFSNLILAQDAAKAPEFGWSRSGGFGADLSGIGILNPRVGAGGNRFGLGGLVTYFAKKKEAKNYWDNDFSLQLSAQKLGNDDVQKNLDLLRINSRYGLKKLNEKFWVSIDGLAQTGILPTYKGNYLTATDEANKTRDLLSKFLAPATLQLSPGIDFRPNSDWSLFFSPASWRLIFVGDDALALLNVHGNDVGKNSSNQLGASLVAKYNHKFLSDRVGLASEWNFYSNYLKEPQNIDVFWKNNLSIGITKGLSLDLLGTLFYDHDVLVQTDRNGDDDNIDDLDRGRRAEMIGSFLLKFSKQL